MEAALFCITSDKGPLAVNLIRDTSEQAAYINKLTEYGLFDELTSLHNRRFLTEELKILLAQARRRKEKLAFFLLILIDLNLLMIPMAMISEMRYWLRLENVLNKRYEKVTLLAA